jgi:hypothetical protein
MNWLDFPLPKISMFWSLQDIASFLPNNSDSFSKTEGPRRIWIDLHLVQMHANRFSLLFSTPLEIEGRFFGGNWELEMFSAWYLSD